MRRMILSSLVLLPVLTYGQASALAESKPSTPSALLQAELTRPAGLAEVALAASKADAAASSIKLSSHTLVREFIRTQFSEDLTQAALRQTGSLQFTLASTAPTEVSAPKVTRSVELGLTQQELAAQPAVTVVAVHATVDAYGIPRNVAITQSAGALVDKKALAAVSAYRFKPATIDNRPVEAAVSIAIKIEKQ